MKISSPKAINWTLKQYGYTDTGIPVFGIPNTDTETAKKLPVLPVFLTTKGSVTKCHFSVTYKV
jgi:hypothetical protein